MCMNAIAVRFVCGGWVVGSRRCGAVCRGKAPNGGDETVS